MHTCIICGNQFKGRSDRKWCNLSCKEAIKRQYDSERYAKNRDEVLDRTKLWYRDNTKRKQEYDRIRRETIPEYFKSIRDAYTPKPRSSEYGRNAASLRRARKNQNGAYSILDKDYHKLLDRYRNSCAYCQEMFTDSNPLEWDHVVPLSRGGSHSVGNILPVCRKCNRSKQVKFLVEWRYNKVVSTRFK